MISVMMITRNHEKFVAAAIRSILKQSHKDLELIIVNDGSTDNTQREIDAFSDPRMRAIHQPQEGPSMALNRAFNESRGELVAIMSGDDESREDRLEKQLLAHQQTGAQVLFSHIQCINETGEAIPKPAWLGHSFNVANRSHAETIRALLLTGNFVNAVTLFASRDALQSVTPPDYRGPFHPAYLQLQDYELWLRLSQKYGFHIVQEALANYRILSGNLNLSSPDQKKDFRVRSEYALAIKGYLNGIPEALFRAAFKQEIRRPDFSGAIERKCEEGFICLESTLSAVRLRGMETLTELVAYEESAKVLREKYNFAALDLSGEMLRKPLLLAPKSVGTTLFIDAGNGYEPDKIEYSSFVPNEGPFRLSFNLMSWRNIRQLRWDPLEGSPIDLQIKSISLWQGGKPTSVKTQELITNGRLNGHELRFETLDPQVMINVSSKLDHLIIEGEVRVRRPSLLRITAKIAKGAVRRLWRSQPFGA